jgi:hypothetical protein
LSYEARRSSRYTVRANRAVARGWGADPLRRSGSPIARSSVRWVRADVDTRSRDPRGGVTDRDIVLYIVIVPKPKRIRGDVRTGEGE